MRTLYAVSLVLILLLDVSCGAEFEWSSNRLGDCVANDTTLGFCARARNVKCIKKISRQPIPDYYCEEFDHSSKPAAHVPCDVKECSLVCVVSMWSTWNPCDPACVRPFRYRTRNILSREQANGVASCPTLIERERCVHCSKDLNKDIFMWQVGKWGSCRQFKTVAIDNLAVKNTMSGADVPASQLCGPLMKIGKSTRKVRCVDQKGREVRARKCLNYKDKFGRITQRPGKSKVCRLPCGCRMSEWSLWSGCPLDCHAKEERRTRDVLYPGQLGGKPCGKLEEKRLCDTKRCPGYEWYAAPWGDCQTQTYQGMANKSHCGHGFSERAVICVKSTHKKSMSEIQPVQQDRCDRSSKLVSRKKCHIACPNDCKVSNWHPWEACSTSCGKAGIKKRRRTVLQPAGDGGKECPNLVEMSRCEAEQCFSWSKMQWSECFLSSKCGSSGGTSYRLVFCQSVNGTWESNKKCSHLRKPAAMKSCSKPCPYDCALSLWSEWGPCSKSCGIMGGIQTRHKKILAYPGTGGAPCPKAKDLVERRKCNQYTLCETEMNFMWKTGAWSKCEPLVKGNCGHFMGIKKRHVHCGTRTLNLTNYSFCGQDFKPPEVKPCDVPCSKNCVLSKWEEWSRCNQTCGFGGVQVRHRYIVQEASHNGLQCPLGIRGGVQKESRPCVAIPSCYKYKWVASNWRKCKLLPQTKLKQTKCGAGYQTRKFSCIRSDQNVVNGSFCLKSLLMAPPTTLKECWIPCPDDCVRSDWSPWTACPNKCTLNSPSYRTRNRQVVNLSPARGGFSTTCPQLTELDFSENDKCPTLPCFSYKWHEGPWGSCISKQISLSCGTGGRKRNVLCQRSDKTYVSDVNCNTTKPVSWQSCSVNCSRDCTVGPWGKWSSCSVSCGDSVQERHRTIVKSPTGLGKSCPSLTEKQLCQQTSCTSFKWSAELWSTCQLNTNNSCGNGTQTRKVVCLPDPTREVMCLKQAPKPVTVQPCELPCPGDCVLSNWSPWSTCTSGKNGCSQERWRAIVRKASKSSAKKCNDKPVKELQPCDCPAAGTWVGSEWTSCLLNHTYGPKCGKGQQFRSVKCVSKKGQILDDVRCNQKNKSDTSKDCHVKCPVDCVLGKWSPWSRCSKDCGTDGMEMRSRNITVPGKNGGRKCPDESNLVQKRPCNGNPCYTYTLNKGKWSKCYVDGQGCGHGTQSREAWCLRSDGQSVNLHYCFEKSKRLQDNSQFQSVDVLQSVLNTISVLSITRKRKCVEPCPGNCVLSKWSEWSYCGRNCFQKTDLSYQSRTRVIISKPLAGGKACSPELWQTRSCQPNRNDQCIGAEWKTGIWQANGTREVWCQTSTGLNVTGACVIKNKPSSTKRCDPACSDPNAVCTDGKCVCKPLFEYFQYQCIPVKGCLHDGHCMFKNTVCKRQGCECREGHVRNATTGPCTWQHQNGSVTFKVSTTQLPDVCDPPCSDPNAACIDGKCICKPSFKLFLQQCIPVKGCSYDGDCMFKNTVCKEQKCECREGHVRNTATGPCFWQYENSSTTFEVSTSQLPLCDPACSDPNSVCINGKCICKPLFKLFQHQCIPADECLDNGDCMFKNTVCKGQMCECKEGHARNTRTGPCVQLQEYSTTTSASANSHDIGNKIPVGGEEKLQSYWKWVGIGAGILLLMILLAVGVICYTRRKNRTKEKKQDKNANPIELLRILSLKEGEEPRPAKV